MVTKKQQLGQFWTRNTSYILAGLEGFVRGKDVCDPFAGGQDLLKWAKNNGAKSIAGFEIDENCVDDHTVFLNDSLASPKEYRFVITNPPYLYQNKLHDNSILKDSKHTDLFQLSLEKIMNSEEGIAIVPINFLSAENSRYIRESFLEKFDIKKVNYFTEQVFEDTTYNVMAFYYVKKDKPSSTMIIDFNILPEGKNLKVKIASKFNWQIGGEFLASIKTVKNKLGLRRLEESDISRGDISISTAHNHLKDRREIQVDKAFYDRVKNNIVILKAIDTGSEEGKICLENIKKYGIDALVSIKTSRNQIQIIFPECVSVADQEKIIELFNGLLNEKREEYFSLFMTNFRDNDRKRISFRFAYDLINYVYFNMLRERTHEG